MPSRVSRIICDGPGARLMAKRSGSTPYSPAGCPLYRSNLNSHQIQVYRFRCTPSNNGMKRAPRERLPTLILPNALVLVIPGRTTSEFDWGCESFSIIIVRDLFASGRTEERSCYSYRAGYSIRVVRSEWVELSHLTAQIQTLTKLELAEGYLDG